MSDNGTAALARWLAAGVIDAETAARIRAFEQGHGRSTRLRWPIWLAIGFGGLMLGAGVLLFVSAHWESISPLGRFSLVLLMVGGFHLVAAMCAEKSPWVATTLHAVGTASLGAGIFLAGQIFNLDEHWPGGVMLWALGAGLAWALVREWPQLAWLALLAPAWLISEWFVAIEGQQWWASGVRIPAAGAFLLALAYFSAPQHQDRDYARATLGRIGGLALLPACGVVALTSPTPRAVPTDVSLSLLTIGWMVALGVPMGVAQLLGGRSAWKHAIAAVWVLALFGIPQHSSVLPYIWWALGAAGLAWWGVHEGRSDGINMASAIFAGTVGAFYFSEVMDKLGRSASLIAFGVLFLAGGWALDRVRRRLVLHTRGGEA